MKKEIKKLKNQKKKKLTKICWLDFFFWDFRVFMGVELI